MFSGGKSLPPPPSSNQSRNDSLGAMLSSYRNRPAGSTASNNSEPSGLNFSSVRSMFETAKPMGSAIANLARIPAVQNTALAVAKDEKLRSAAVSAAKNPQIRNTALEFAMASQGRTMPIDSSNSRMRNTSSLKRVDEIARQFENRPIMGFGAPASSSSITSTTASDSLFGAPQFGHKTGWSTTAYPTPSQLDPFDFPPQLPPSNVSKFKAQLPLYDEIPSEYSARKKTAPPSRPPPPKMTTSRSNPNINSLADELSGIDFSGVGATAASPPPGALNEPYAIVKYPYNEVNTDELSCQPDDLVILKREVDDHWIYATNTRTGKSGIVPILFLQIRVPLAPMNGRGLSSSSAAQIITDNNPAWMKNRNKLSGKCMAATALYDFDTGVTGDLKFKAADSIFVIARVNEEWLRGETSGRTGIFPLNYVSIANIADLSSLPDESKASAMSAATTLTAAFDYTSDVAGDLSFRAGDLIHVLRYHDDSQWITGRLERTGQMGLVPLTYMQSSA